MMSDNLVRRLREGDEFERFILAERAADRIEELEAKLWKAVELVECSFNEGFGEGMNDVLLSRGGKTWYDSRSRKRLAELNGEKNE